MTCVTYDVIITSEVGGFIFAYILF